MYRFTVRVRKLGVEEDIWVSERRVLWRIGEDLVMRSSRPALHVKYYLAD
jgi:hypothetical protein